MAMLRILVMMVMMVVMMMVMMMIDAVDDQAFCDGDDAVTPLATK